MRKTPHYLLEFYQQGDIYSASQDLNRMTTIDNQLDDLSKIVGDGVLFGWSVYKSSDIDITASDLEISVSTGYGFIGGVYHTTKSIKTGLVLDEEDSFIYLMSKIFDGSAGFPIEMESPSSGFAGATFTDSTAPVAPTTFEGDAVSFDIVNLNWDANTENDLAYYEIQRDTTGAFSTPVLIGSPIVNGTTVDPFQDTGLTGTTDYYYRIRAVDRSGNTSSWTNIVAPGYVTTQADTRVPAEISNLKLVPGNSQIAITFNGSPGGNVQSYKITLQMLQNDGSIDTTPSYTKYEANTAGSVPILSESLAESYQLTNLPNNRRYRITVQARAVSDSGATPPGNLNNGVIAEVSITSGSAPLDVLNPIVVAGQNSIALSWTASPSPSSLLLPIIGQKTKYVVIPIIDGEEQFPIDVGLNTSATIYNYNEVTDVGVGPLRNFSERTKYIFKIATEDGFGNRSGGTTIYGYIQNTTPPKAPRGLFGVAGDKQISLTWTHSSSAGVIGYGISYEQGLGYSSEVLLPFVNNHIITGLTNNILTTVRLRAKNDAGLFSTYINTVTTPVEDLTPPEIPIFVKTEPQDSQIKVTWGEVTADGLVRYVVERQIVNAPTNFQQNVVYEVLSSVELDMGLSLGFTDTGLINSTSTSNTTYGYRVKAVRQNPSGNEIESLWSSVYYARAREGLNTGSDRLNAPTNLAATFDSLNSRIVLNWDFTFPGMILNGGLWEYPLGNGPTAFNIYRSETDIVGYDLIDSISAGLRTYSDSNLVSGTTYYYVVTAVRDQVELVIDTGSIQPANSILIATVSASGATITSISNEQRIVDSLQASIEDETLRKLLEHKHTTRPINHTTVDLISELTMTEVNEFIDTCFTSNEFTCGATLNPNLGDHYYDIAIQSVQDIVTNTTSPFTTGSGQPLDGQTTRVTKNVIYNTYDDNRYYIIDPRLLTWNAPFVGDFQVLVNGERPSVSFTIDHDLNAIVFDTALSDADEVTLDGLSLTYYVPVKIDNRNIGYRVLVNALERTDAFVDESVQTVRFASEIVQVQGAAQNTIQLEIEPVIPDYTGQVGARQIGLSPDYILSDFLNETQKTFRSLSGNFLSTDTLFVLVDGVRTNRTYYIDFDTKSVVFDRALPANSVVSMEVKNVEEVTDELSSLKIGDLDGSQVKSGTLLEAQLPELSHEGRVKELALPKFSELNTTDKYVYSADGTSVGNGTTPYAITTLEDGNFMLGTSSGLLKTFLIPGFLLSSTDDLSLSSQLPIGAGLTFSADNIVQSVRDAVSTSGRLRGKVKLPNLDGSSTSVEITDPAACILSDGRVFVTGGDYGSNSCYLYDQNTGNTVTAPDMSTDRAYHTCTILPDGRVLVTGGINGTPSDAICITDAAFDVRLADGDFEDGILGSWFEKTCEVYDPSIGALGTWFDVADMSVKRANHAAIVIDFSDLNSDVLIAGGEWSHRTPVNAGCGFVIEDVPWCIGGNSQYKDGETLACQLKYNDGINSAEKFLTASNTFDDAALMIYPGKSCRVESDGTTVLVVTDNGGQVYNNTEDAWTATEADCATSSVNFTNDEIFDGPIKLFFKDADDRRLAVTRKNIFVSDNEGKSWVKMEGLDSIGIIHAITQTPNKTLFAATDLGVYEITEDILSGNKWFQGGLIGAGTTETFDLQDVGGRVFAATEIGIFYTDDDGDTWIEAYEIDNVHAIEYGGEGLFFAIADQTLLKSETYGSAGSWTKVAKYNFIDDNSKLAVRAPFELVISTSSGLQYSRDGLTFDLYDFPKNRDLRSNNIHLLQVIGSDIYVGFDNILYIIDPSGKTYPVAEFIGSIPTVTVNDVEIKNGFYFNTKDNSITFENKRFVNDIIKMTSSYGTYILTGGSWYGQNPNGTMKVYVNRKPADDGLFVKDARLGQVVFSDDLTKFDEVRVSIAGTTLKNEGEYFHSELEDNLEKEKGLPLSLGRDHVGNILQMGLSIEHNFPDYGPERNQYYCLQENMVHRSFTSFLVNSEFFILGRKEFDCFNSTIDYKLESKQEDIGTAAFVPTCSLQFSTQELWVGTDAGIFVLDPLNLFAIKDSIELDSEENDIRDMCFALNAVYVVTRDGIYGIVEDGADKIYSRNSGAGLPDNAYSINVLHNTLIVGTDDGIYFATSDTDPTYEIWTRASHIPANNQQIELELKGSVTSIGVKEGIAYAFIGPDVFLSYDAKVWKKVFTFADTTIRINRVAFLADEMFVATTKGLFSDEGTGRSEKINFSLVEIDSTLSEAQNAISLNDVFASEDALYTVGETQYVYKLKDGEWTRQVITEVQSIHLIVLDIGGSLVAISNTSIFVE